MSMTQLGHPKSNETNTTEFRETECRGDNDESYAPFSGTTGPIPTFSVSQSILSLLYILWPRNYKPVFCATAHLRQPGGGS